MVKRFTIGFLVGLGLMYGYLENKRTGSWDMTGWFSSTASRDEGKHDAARRVLGK